MEKQRDFLRVFEGEDRLLAAQTADKLEQCQRQNRMTHTMFLTPHERGIAERVISCFGTPPHRITGGYDAAERCVLLCLPDYMQPQGPEQEDLPFGAIRVNWGHSAALTHRDILKQDVEECLAYVFRMDDFLQRLRQKGYTVVRGDSYEHISVKAPDWSRAVRLDNIGYPIERVQTVLRDHLYDNHFLIVYNSHLPPKRRPLPLLSLERQLDYNITHAKETGTVLLDLVFYLVLRLLGLTQDEEARRQNIQPLSPSMRMEVAKLDQLIEEQKLLTGKGIRSVQELSSFQSKTERQIKSLEAERQQFRNHLRRPKSPELTEEYKQKIAAATEELKPLRKELAVAKRIEDRWERLLGLLEAEHDLESKELQLERGCER